MKDPVIEHTAEFLQKLFDYAAKKNDQELNKIIVDFIDENSKLIIKSIIEREQIIDLIKNN